MRSLAFVLLNGMLSGPMVAAGQAQLSQPDPVASKIDAMTNSVRHLLIESALPYPDPWKPQRSRPPEFWVVPGEKFSYAERLTGHRA